MNLKLISDLSKNGETSGRNVINLAKAEERLHGGHHQALTSSRDQIVKIIEGGTSERLAQIPVRSAARHSPQAGDVLDARYRLDEEIGHGGVCIVYRAYDLLLKMTVAVKTLKPEASGDPDFVQTLLDEARTAMKLSHSQIVRLHTLQETAGFYYLVMEHLEGQTLRECLADYEALPRETVTQIIEACHPPLRHAHKKGILHNDIKPDNILLDNSGSVKLLDFGLSCLANLPVRNRPLLGTPAYMSPERLRGEVLDPRSDIYSFGLTAYELLTGRLPFPENLEADDFLQMGSIVLADAPLGLRDVLEKAVAHRKEDRWETVDDFITAFLRGTGKIE